jgi:caffeoyl-CoA O-methyltransferase
VDAFFLITLISPLTSLPYFHRMDLIPPNISDYAEVHSTPETPALKKLNRETNAKVLMPRMLSGHLQGRILSMISHMLKPQRILEIGTYTGYAAICLSEGLAEGGLLHTIDINEELKPMVKKYLAMAGCEKKIQLHTGDASAIIPEIIETFDLVFIDADKKNYAVYFDLVLPKMSKGGIIIADNVLWSGKILGNISDMDSDTRALALFNEKIQSDKRIENVLLPVRDGLMVMRVI